MSFENFNTKNFVTKETASLSTPRYISEIKISVPEGKNYLGSLDTLPDFDCLPDIPKLNVKLNIDDLTRVPSQPKESVVKPEDKLDHGKFSGRYTRAVEDKNFSKATNPHKNFATLNKSSNFNSNINKTSVALYPKTELF